MNTKDLIEQISNKTGISKSEVKAVFDTLEVIISEQLKQGDSVAVAGIGKFSVKDRPERMVRNPSTGQQFMKEADKVVKITIAKSLKDQLNS